MCGKKLFEWSRTVVDIDDLHCINTLKINDKLTDYLQPFYFSAIQKGLIVRVLTHCRLHLFIKKGVSTFARVKIIEIQFVWQGHGTWMALKCLFTIVSFEWPFELLA
jgi:hypothetical protein